MTDLHQYRAQLLAKLEAVDQILADMGQAPTASNNHKPQMSTAPIPGKRTMSLANRAKLAMIAKARWKKAKAAGKIHL